MAKDTIVRSSSDDKVVRFFNKFSESTGVYISSFDYYGQILADFTGDESERELLKKYFTEEMRQSMFERLTIDSIEDQIVEDTASPHIKAAAIALKFEGQCREVWFFAGVIEDTPGTLPTELHLFSKITTTRRFLKTCDALREMGLYRVNAELSLAQYQEQSRKSLFSANEMAESLKRVETLTNILKFFDSEKSTEAIMSDFLRYTSEYLGVEEADVFKIKSEPGFTMDVVTGWLAPGMVAPYDRTVDILQFPFLTGKKPIILSAGASSLSVVKEEWPRLDARALVAMPITIGQVTNMYAVYFETREDRNWKIEELQFLSDAIRVLQNILEKRIQKNSLASSYASLEQILEHVGCAIIVNDVAREKTLFQNKIMRNIFPLEEISSELNEIIWENRTDDQSEIEYYDYDSGNWYDINHSNIIWVDGRPVSLYAIYDVTDKKNYQKRIEQQAYTDFLTGLLNRMCCERDLARFIDEAEKRGETGALLYMDLDDFKHINDGLGHQYGDVLLKNISGAIHSIKGIEDSCYRMGGDEFVMIVPPRSYKFFNEIIDNIKAVFARPWYLKDGDYYCKMSMGYVTFPDEGNSVEDLIKKADIAMYSAKKSGKNKVAKYNSNFVSDSTKRLDMEKNMRDATNNGFGEFLVYYQPVIDITDGNVRCTGAEALIRWDSQELGFINPGDFIPLAEHLGLINPIGDYVLKEACKECKKWNDNGHPEYKVNVNLSVVQLMQENIVDIIKETVEETGVTPHNLTLEVTESLAINDMDRMKGIMSEIRKLGVRIALDDFGTGYSSLNHIREIPLDVIKVDQSFIKELVDDDYSKSFIRMVGELAGAIGVTICVEGVEKEEQYKILDMLNVHLVQGFFFDKPMTGDDFEAKYLNV